MMTVWVWLDMGSPVQMLPQLRVAFSLNTSAFGDTYREQHSLGQNYSTLRDKGGTA